MIVDTLEGIIAATTIRGSRTTSTARAAARSSTAAGAERVEREANYAAVGAVRARVHRCARRRSSGGTRTRSDRRDYTRYEIYFDGRVSGLVGGQPGALPRRRRRPRRATAGRPDNPSRVKACRRDRFDARRSRARPRRGSDCSVSPGCSTSICAGSAAHGFDAAWYRATAIPSFARARATSRRSSSGCRTRSDAPPR